MNSFSTHDSSKAFSVMWATTILERRIQFQLNQNDKLYFEQNPQAASIRKL